MSKDELAKLQTLYSAQDLQQCRSHPKFAEVFETGTFEEVRKLASRILTGMAKSTREKREKNLRYKVFRDGATKN